MAKERVCVRVAVVPLLLLGLTMTLCTFAAEPPFQAVWKGVKAPMPQAAGWASSCEVGGKIYVFGGHTTTETVHNLNLSNTQIYNPAADAWTVGAPMPTGRAYTSAVYSGGKMYIMGGVRYDSEDNSTLLDINEAYDPATDTWTTETPLPVPIHSQAAAAVGGKIYLFGGYTGTYQSSVLIYDTVAKSWDEGHPMGSPRMGAAAVYIPSAARIYVIGGRKANTGASNYLGNAIIYDPATDSWSDTVIPLIDRVANFPWALDPSTDRVFILGGRMWDGAVTWSGKVQVLDTSSGTCSECNHPVPSPMNRMGSTGALVGGNAYVMGGWSGERLVDVLDVATGTWYQPNAPLPTLNGAAGNFLPVGGKLYFLNGINFAFQPNDQVFLYDPSTGVWTTRDSWNPGYRLYAVAGVYQDKIVFAGGLIDEVDQEATYLYDPATDTFAELAPHPSPTNDACGAMVGGTLYYFGGYKTVVGEVLPSVWALDIASNTWTAKADMPIGRAGGTAKAIDGKIYIIGGDDWVTVDPRVLVYDPATDSFSYGAPMPLYAFWGDSAVFGDRILFYGGYHWYMKDDAQYFPPAGLLQVYHPATDTWTSTKGLWARMDERIAVLGNTLYVTGGHDDFTICDRLDIANLVEPPVVTSMKKATDPFRVVVKGENLQDGVMAYINGEIWPKLAWHSSKKIVLKGGADLKAALPKGVSRHFEFRNPDGSSARMDFTR